MKKYIYIWTRVIRSGNVCIVKMKVTPEHNVKKKYAVVGNIEEESRKVIGLHCQSSNLVFD